MDMARHMGAVAATDQLCAQIAALRAAVITRDAARIASAELALRSAALGLIGLGAMDNAAMALLQDAILTLRQAADTLGDDTKTPRASIGRRIYMRLGPGGAQ
jgi:hypothetical protein